MESYSTARFSREILALSRFLASSGGDGERVAIFSENRPGWHVADFAVLLAGRVVVPVSPALGPEQIEYVLRHSDCSVAIIGGRRQWEILSPRLSSLPQLRQVISLDDLPAAHISLPRIVAETPECDPATREAIRERALSVNPQTLATIVYTAGTTGDPKGVMLSHGNIVFDLRESLKRVLQKPPAQALSVLPLPHLFERLICYSYFYCRVPIAYGDLRNLKTLLPLHRPEVMGSMPYVLEKLQEMILAQIREMPAWRRSLARAVLRAGSWLARHRPGQILPGRSLASLPADRLLFSWLRRQAGGLRYLICGGAWLDPELELFFRGAGFDLVQGYGVTEASPLITLNPQTREKLGSVGPALEGVQLRLREDGEILTRGPHVMLGYYNDPEATRTAFRDGWLLTGDIGKVDEEGYLQLVGRRTFLSSGNTGNPPGSKGA
ncbi:MAG TPA: AMP-binding protein, partial [Verrucomicrobiae bacterium]|nr:AMP-binding protein [Verrucomicrobiae bacterium]